MNSRRSHEWIDRRSLALAQAVAAKIRDNPELFSVALENIERWKTTMHPLPSALKEWEEILSRGCEAALELLTEDTERGRRLRQSNPFAGVLTSAERNAIYRRYEKIAA